MSSTTFDFGFKSNKDVFPNNRPKTQSIPKVTKYPFTLRLVVTYLQSLIHFIPEKKLFNTL